jgi:hypothetical protein
MKRILTIASCFVLALTMASAARADVVSDFWSNVLSSPGVNVGDTIRVVFVTSSVIDGNGQTQAYYDSFGDASAAAGLLTGSFGPVEWNPLVSTPEVAGSSNPVKNWIQYSSLTVGSNNESKIFNTAGQLVANLGVDMLDTNPDPTVNNAALVNGIRYDDSGDDQAPNGSVGVWTGTAASGASNPNVPSGVALNLGSPVGTQQTVPYSVVGDGGQNANLTDWLEATYSPRSLVNLGGSPTNPQDLTSIERSIYVMSGEITVVPEPSTILLWLGFSGIAGMVYWRKRRSS